MGDMVAIFQYKRNVTETTYPTERVFDLILREKSNNMSQWEVDI